eukprot:359499-Chlamydomonas_euryale.AAC.4
MRNLGYAIVGSDRQEGGGGQRFKVTELKGAEQTWVGLCASAGACLDPQCLLSIHKFKAKINGPWDEAVPHIPTELWEAGSG